ncbi:MAG: hypothetical protein ABWK53_04190 [Anaerolineales bacterium]
MKNRLLLAVLLFLAACGPSETEPPAPLTVQYTAAARPWLAPLEECAAAAGLVIRPVGRAAAFFDPAADLAIRIGEPAAFSAPAYQIGEEQIAFVIHPQNPVTALDWSALQSVFGGQTVNWQEVGGPDLPIQVWAYAEGEDLQQILGTVVLQNRPIASTARLAASPEDMAASIGADPAAIGFLPGRQVPETLRRLTLPSQAQSALTIPVLALPGPEPSQAIVSILACLQR